jgi:threonine synthase
MWRYLEALPIESNTSIISFDEGWTPMLNMELSGREIMVKQEHLFQTGSYKDRGASVLISKAKELGVIAVVEDSSGNAGCAVAAYCARAGIDCEIFVPATTSPGKLVQIEMYGARLNKISGSREDTALATMQSAERVYYASHSWNPWFFQGTKTFAYEVCEQLGWQAPDSVILPVGNGTLLLGVYIGFRELRAAGIISRLPRLIGVQSDACSPLADAYKTGRSPDPRFVSQKTIAEGIAIALPVRGHQILDCIRDTNGDFITVNDAEIKDAVLQMAHKGIFIEPTSGACIAAVSKYRAQPEEKVVTVTTGHGLKATDKWLTK